VILLEERDGKKVLKELKLGPKSVRSERPKRFQS